MTLAHAAMGENRQNKDDELFVTRTTIEHALAEIDVGLGLACPTPHIIVMPSNTNGIEEELDAVMNCMRQEREQHTMFEDPIDDNTSCVSGSGALGRGNVAKIEETSARVGTSDQLQRIRCDTTAMSPRMPRSLYKRRRTSRA